MKRWIIFLAIGLSVIATGGFLADRALKSRSHPGLRTFLRQWWVNYPASFQVDPKLLSIQVEQRDLDAIKAVVTSARERGVIMPEGNEYVPAEFEFEGTRFRAKLRIKGKMDDHVKGSKWSFRVVARKDGGFMGMERFSLQHPGTRNYLCDWFYHRLMRGEGAIALRYGFVRLRFNDEDLGVYAFEEHFGPELLANNGRLKGPLFRFDPGLFWIHRLNMIQRVRYNEAFGTYQAAALDAFAEGALTKDSAQLAYFEEAIGRMDAFRRAELKASEAFDVEGVAIRHAILDLVGGHHSMDWSDVKYYFDPVLKRIEPVAYESFSAFPIRELAGSGKYTGSQAAHMDLHEAYFNDPVIFRAYVRALERVSEKAYLDSAFSALAPALDSASAIVYREFPYKELDRNVYYGNQRTIIRLLDVPKGFHAYLGGGQDTLHVIAVPLEALPMEVHGIVMEDGSVVPPVGGSIVPIRPASGIGMPVEMRFAVGDASVPKDLKLRYSVLGASRMKELEVFPYAYRDGMTIRAIPTSGPLKVPGSVVVDEARSMVLIPPGVHIIDKDVFIPPGFTVFARSPLRLEISDGARFVSRSPLDLRGTDDAPITISMAQGASMVVLTTEKASQLEHVVITGSGSLADGPLFLAQDAEITLRACTLATDSVRDVLLAVRSDLDILGGSFVGGRDQLTSAYGRISMKGTAFNAAGDDAITIKGGGGRLQVVSVHQAGGNALKLDEFAELESRGCRLSSVKDALVVSEGAMARVDGGSLASGTGAAVGVAKVHGRHGPSTLVIQGTEMESAAAEPEIGAGNSVEINGRSLGAGTNRK